MSNKLELERELKSTKSLLKRLETNPGLASNKEDLETMVEAAKKAIKDLEAELKA